MALPANVMLVGRAFSLPILAQRHGNHTLWICKALR